jgi:hypothetical protein
LFGGLADAAGINDPDEVLHGFKLVHCSLLQNYNL